MEDMSPAVAVTLSLGNSICNTSGFSSQVEITRLKLVTETASMLSNSPAMPPSPLNFGGDDSHKEIKKGINPLSISGADEDSFDGASLSNTVSENIRSITTNDSATQESEEDEVLSVVDEPNGLIGAELLALAAGSEMSLPASVEVIAVGDGKIIANAIIIGEHSNDNLPNGDVVMQDGPSAVNASAVAIQLPKEKGHGGGIRSVFELDCIPLWGSISIRGERPEMEDAIASVPRLLKIPIKMLIGDRVVEGLSHSLTHQTTHFFGVYDGHGGSQVANYCRDRIHSALVEEINSIEASFANGLIGENWQAQWEKAFTGCFQKVDDEIGGKTGQNGNEGSHDVSEAIFEPLAPETVGSTAVVALVCSSHIIVANCGDSRAVLCRGKEAMALSVDHKPNREDEFARIEAVGGKVIQWNGYRVLGVLAMSRSIGDRYLKPSIIAEPEVMFVPRAREDECLILASDGLWDVMSNEEVCEVARKKIWLWHKKNGVTSLGGRGNGIDPAAQAAADYLCFLAQQRGSTDNISVIVVDLKAQRKFKSKSNSSNSWIQSI